MQDDNAYYNEVKDLEKSLTGREIILKVGGGDLTEKGSCASIALAYAANKLGYDVLDFRGGESRTYFSENSRYIIDKRIDRKNSAGFICNAYATEDSDLYEAFNKIRPLIKEKKEYILGIAHHMAIIRKQDNSEVIEYLELQEADEKENTFKVFNKDVLNDRFGGKEARKKFNSTNKKLGLSGDNKLKHPVNLIDIDDLKDNENFKKILGYINTAGNEQQKEEKGVKNE